MVKKKILKADVYVVEAQVSFLFLLASQASQKKGRKIAAHYGQIFPKRIEKGDSLPLENL